MRSFTTAPMGEVDGAVLENGTLIHWPPHLADRFTSAIARGDRIRVAGRMENGPAGDTHLEVQTVTNLRTNAAVQNDFGPPMQPPRDRQIQLPPAPAPGARLADVRTVQGRVLSFTTAPMGEVDGANLDDGSVIHWPPHLADRFTAILTRGERVKASGWMETGPAGDSHFEVLTATNLRTGASAGNDVAGPLPATSGRVGPRDSDDFAVTSKRTVEIGRRLKALEDQIAQLREEIRKIRDEL